MTKKNKKNRQSILPLFFGGGDKKDKKHGILTHKQTGILLVLLGIFLVGFISLFMYYGAAREQDPASILRADEVASYIEIPLAPSDSIYQSLIQKTIELPGASSPSGRLTDQTWLPGHVSLVTLKPIVEGEQMENLYMGSTSDPEATLAFFAGTEFTREKYLHAFIYTPGGSLPGRLAVGFYGDIFIVSEAKETIERVLDDQLSGGKRLSKLLHGGNFFADESVLPPQMGNLEYLAGGFDVKGSQIEFNAKGFLKEKEKNTLLHKKFSAMLLSNVPADNDLLIGSSDIKRLLQVCAACANVPTLNDLLSGGEYVLSLYGNDDSPHLLFVANFSNNSSIDLNKTVAEALKKIAANISPEKRALTLKDGSTAYEMIANPDIIKFEETESFTKIILPEKDRVIYYSLKGNRLFLSTSEELLLKSINGDKNNFYTSGAYTRSLRSVLRGVETVFYVSGEGAKNYLDIPRDLDGGNFSSLSLSERSFSNTVEWFGVLK